MSVLHLDDVSRENVANVQSRVENNFTSLDEIVQTIISPYCKELDDYVKFILSVLKDTNNPPTDEELDDFCLYLPTLMYFAGGMCEQLGIKDDVARAVYKEMYNSSRAAQNEGTVADKDSLAELASQYEQITSVCYSRAYKIMKSKIDNAQELLGSVKKVISRRMQETELTKMAGAR